MITEEIKQKFKEENGIEIDEAISHIEKWIEEKNFPSAENWIKEIEKFVQNESKVNRLKEELAAAKSVKLDHKHNEIEEKAKEKIVKKETPLEGTVYTKWEKTLSALSYFWFLAILPLVLKKDSELCQHHWKQGIVFAILFFVILTVSKLIPFWLWWLISWITSLLQIVIAIFGWMQAFGWKMRKAPMANEIARKLEF